MEKSRSSKIPYSGKKTETQNQSFIAEHQNQTRDDEEQGMISKKPVQQTSETLKTQSSNPKYYHVINPNLDKSQYFEEESVCGNFRHLTLKSLIIFLLLLLLLMFGVYKAIQQVYEIQHPEEMLARKIKYQQINIQKEKSLRQKQQKEAQNPQKSMEDLTPKTVDTLPNGLKTTEKRFKQTIEKKQIIEVEKESIPLVPDKVQVKSQDNSKPQAPSNQQSKTSAQEIESAIKQREQDIETLQNQQPSQTQSPKSPENKQHSHSSSKAGQNSINAAQQISTRLQNSNPVIQNSAKYLWYTTGTGPVAKAGITKQQAIKWKGYAKMIQIPLNTPYQDDPLLKQEYEYFEKKYQISQYKQLPICVVVPSYNNAQNSRYKVNMQSILQQNYSNYHVVLIDDKSDDHTGEFVKEYLSQFEPKFRDKVKVIINQERKMAMPNLRYAAMNECQENQLFIIIDGDDSLIGRQVFKLFSAVMQKKNLWVMWTNFLSPKSTIGYSREYPEAHRKKNDYRKAGFVMSHLRAYYTKLFRLIKEEDLKDEKGQYLHAANDVAIGIPILQMAHLHTAYVPEISYFYNMNTGLNNHRVRLKEQKDNDKKLRKRPKYQALPSLDFNSNHQTQTIEPKQQNILPLEKPQILKSIQPKEQSDMKKMEQMLHPKANQLYLQSSDKKSL